MKKILLVFGTRPEAIKMAPLVYEFKKNDDIFETKVCVTGQHREMLDQVLEVFNILPDFDLDIMRKQNSLCDLTALILDKMNEVMDNYAPDLVIVHGDTTTAFSAALAAFYRQIEVAHVEAGLRTFDLSSPFPEEFNRQGVGLIAKYHFAPTITAAKNLKVSDNVNNKIIVTGNTVIDALHWVCRKIDIDVTYGTSINNFIRNAVNFDFKKYDYILVTAHRRENLGVGIENICDALIELSKKNPNIKIIFPVHLNPAVRNIVNPKLKDFDNIYLIEPVAYPIFTQLLRFCLIVLTDSGGIQEEAPSFGIPVFVMRDKTERPEAIEAGTVCTVGTNPQHIVNVVQKVLTDKKVFDTMSKAINPYGNGTACGQIVKYFEEKYSNENT